jgi:hypothetical protein
MNTFRRAWLGSLMLLTTLLLGGAPASAQNAVERLLMPGELSKAHAKLEPTCDSCHKALSKEAQTRLCLDCHKPVAADIATSRGFHGKNPAAGSAECRSCHTEHKGRTADIVQFDRETFDHKLTNFALAGRHAAATCASCHAAGKKFREASSGCADCHRAVSPHKGETGDACQTCHVEAGWKQLKPFDHSKTKFPLTGAHQEAGCKSCHAGERYKNVSTQCADCHKQQDKHNGARGPKCDSCHTTASFALSGAQFDHDTATKFPLRGKHTGKACDSCHKADPKTVKLAMVCGTCHAKDDVHKGSLGQQCQTCHSESGFAVGVLFDHSKTKFPLVGNHARAGCSDCHQSKTYRDVASTCVGCHAKADTHEGRLGTNCAACHAPTGWKGARFDHGRQTKFALTGRHAKATCYSCHTQKHVQKPTLSTDCYSCHKRNDKHRGAFGKNCAKCHSTTTFGIAYVR